ncbi:Endonuclease-reverse transcriptase [Popillia japonica]|uniref:Endonuclease-reverse transcriptase n=1 Tax=Popillia japonica TaxID=7064 RepID=A0AAW1KIA7_POPJA
MFKLAHINARSILKNFNSLKDCVVVNDFDVVTVTETWLNDAVADDLVHINDYIVVREDRGGDRRGGGVCVFLKNQIAFKKLEIITDASCEQLWLSIKINKISIAVGVVYRPPYTNCNDFISNLEENLSNIYVKHTEIFCAGDMNINMLDCNGSNYRLLYGLLDATGLAQVIDEPTRMGRSSCSLLDVVITSAVGVGSGVVDVPGFSDHLLIYCEWLPPTKTTSAPRAIRSYRNFSQVDFDCDLRSIAWDVIYSLGDIDEIVGFFTTNLLQLFDLHAPVITLSLIKQIYRG